MHTILILSVNLYAISPIMYLKTTLAFYLRKEIHSCVMKSMIAYHQQLNFFFCYRKCDLIAFLTKTFLRNVFRGFGHSFNFQSLFPYGGKWAIYLANLQEKFNKLGHTANESVPSVVAVDSSDKVTKSIQKMMMRMSKKLQMTMLTLINYRTKKTLRRTRETSSTSWKFGERITIRYGILIFTWRARHSSQCDKRNET